MTDDQSIHKLYVTRLRDARDQAIKIHATAQRAVRESAVALEFAERNLEFARTLAGETGDSDARR